MIAFLSMQKQNYDKFVIILVAGLIIIVFSNIKKNDFYFQIQNLWEAFKYKPYLILGT